MATVVSIRRDVPKASKAKAATPPTPSPTGGVDIGVEDVLSQRSYLLPPDRRRDMAKAIRVKCPRESLGGWEAGAQRTDPIEILIASSVGRLPHLVPIRYGRMLQSPFAFFRGAAPIMASDLATQPHTHMAAQICGDCHLVNFGGFATPERKLIFDINDFDETCIGPWEWDIKRLVASMVIAARWRGFSDAQAKDMAWDTAASYRDRLIEHAEMPILDAWYEQLDLRDIIDDIPDPESKKLARERLRKASQSSAHTKEFIKLAVEGGEPPKIRDEPPLIFHDSTIGAKKQRAEIDQAFKRYRKTLSPERCILLDRFRMADFALKVVGVGSVGTYCGIMLLVSGAGDPLFLQVKEARRSVLEPFIPNQPYSQQGQRVVVGQRTMQAASDIFLGWTRSTHREFYVRQLRDAKITAPIELMKAPNLRRYGQLCGRVLARAHTRSADPVLLSGYLGKSDAFADAMTSFAMAYADQNDRDHEALVKAARAGRVEVNTEV